MIRKKKILIILHLSLIFCYLIALIVRPNLKENFTRKSGLKLYEEVLQREALFQNLSLESQEELSTGYEEMRHQETPSLFSHPFGFFKTTSSPILIWLALSAIFCVLLLLEVKKIHYALWLLPSLLLGSLMTDGSQNVRSDLFPTETYLSENYPANTLLQGWHQYLITEWAHEIPASEKELFSSQLERGLFAFNIARLQELQKGDKLLFEGFSESGPNFLLYLTLFWNVLFAWMIHRFSKSAALSSQNSFG